MNIDKVFPNIPVCIVCEEEIEDDGNMYDSYDVFCGDNCKEINDEEEMEAMIWNDHY